MQERKYIVRGEIENTIAKKQAVTMVSRDNFTKEDINASLSSIQGFLDNIAKQLNILRDIPNNITLEEGPEETLFINIQGTAEQAKRNEAGEDLETTYFRNDGYTYDDKTKTLYIEPNDGGNK